MPRPTSAGVATTTEKLPDDRVPREARVSSARRFINLYWQGSVDGTTGLRALARKSPSCRPGLLRRTTHSLPDSLHRLWATFAKSDLIISGPRSSLVLAVGGEERRNSQALMVRRQPPPRPWRVDTPACARFRANKSRRKAGMRASAAAFSTSNRPL
jgi:hypothetical protein